MPDGVFGASYTDNPGPCVQALVYRVRQMASNGEDEHVSNVVTLSCAPWGRPLSCPTSTSPTVGIHWI